MDAGSVRRQGALDETLNADGEIVLFWHPDAGVKSAKRSADDGG